MSQKSLDFSLLMTCWALAAILDLATDRPRKQPPSDIMHIFLWKKKCEALGRVADFLIPQKQK